jgi:hypothetical protein
VAVKSAAKVKVAIEAAGDHSFDLEHIRREGGADLVALLLEKAGVDRRMKWRLRIDEKITGTSHTDPIHITVYKPWCVYIKIKPGDNNTAHRCSLLVPDGSDKGYAKELCAKLQLVQSTVNNEWRGKRPRHAEPEPKKEPLPVPVAEEPVPVPVVEEPVPATLAPPKAELNGHHKPAPQLAEEPDILPTEEHEVPVLTEETFSAKKILRDPMQVRDILFAVYKINKLPGINTREHFMDMLRADMKWQDAGKKATGAVITSLYKSDYLMQVVSGVKIVGYRLDDKGKEAVKDLIERYEAEKVATNAPPPPPKPAIDTSKVLQSLGKVGEWFHTASKRLQEIAAEREMLMEQLASLDTEEKEICNRVSDPKTQAVLIQLTEVDIKHHQPA